MDVGKITGHGNVGHGRSDRVDHSPTGRNDPQRVTPQSADVANISNSGRATQAAVEALTERAREDDPARQQVVADAKARLESGELDDPVVYRAIAERLLG